MHFIIGNVIGPTVTQTKNMRMVLSWTSHDDIKRQI